MQRTNPLYNGKCPNIRSGKMPYTLVVFAIDLSGSRSDEPCAFPEQQTGCRLVGGWLVAGPQGEAQFRPPAKDLRMASRRCNVPIGTGMPPEPKIT